MTPLWHRCPKAAQDDTHHLIVETWRFCGFWRTFSRVGQIRAVEIACRCAGRWTGTRPATGAMRCDAAGRAFDFWQIAKV
jgi:hypothetical protein